MKICWKQDRSNVWPPLMLISWQTWGLYGTSSNEFLKIMRNCIIITENAILGNCLGVTQAMNLNAKKRSSYYWLLFLLTLSWNLALYWDFIIWIKICQFKLHHSVTKCFFSQMSNVKCPGVARSINVCGKQNKSNVWPPSMLISWQCLLIYGYLLI